MEGSAFVALLTQDKKLHEECGIIGIFDNDGYDCARIIYYGLYALQHRGQESCGIAVNDNGTIVYHKDTGLVPDVFNNTVLNHLKGTVAIGHVRYSTSGSNMRDSAQPLVTKYVKGTLTIAHNGNISNAAELRAQLENDGAIFQTNNDSEVIAYLIAKERIKCHTVEEAIVNVMPRLKGSYSLIIMSPRKLIAVRDPYGFRPLSLGKIGNSYIFASETCAFDTLGAAFVRDIKPGEIVIISKEGMTSNKILSKRKEASICIFEYIYFARPDSIIEGMSVYEARKRAGEVLAQEHPVEADVVFGVPDSGIEAAIGYAQYSKIPYEEGFIKNRYIGRTFINPEQSQREAGVRIKLNALKNSIKGKKVVMVDDSIVRGTTSGIIVKFLKDAGAKEVHMRISSPPFLWPCYYGTDVPSKSELIACNHSIEDICKLVGADSLGYLSVEGLSKIVDNNVYCAGCFTGEYPINQMTESEAK